MVLPEEIQNAAQALGKSLREDDFIHAYREAFEAFQADPEAWELEQQLYIIYNALIARQQAGEQLTREDTQEFYDLRHRAHADPVISKRDAELRSIKPYLADVADEIGALLGVDYATLAI